MGWYDYGARNYDAALGRWMNIDPMAEKYYNLSPYHMSANNPIVFMDYNGEDYVVTINLENQTATVSATLYAAGEDTAAAQTGADFWNDKSGDFNYNYKDAGNSHSLTVNFEINVQEVSVGKGQDKFASLTKALEEDETGGGNIFQVLPNEQFNENVNGFTQGNHMYVKESIVNSDANTEAHEVGHAIGIPHSNKGVMTISQMHRNRSSSINKYNIKNSVRNAVRERNFRDGRGNSTLNYEGNIKLNSKKAERRFRRGKINE